MHAKLKATQHGCTLKQVIEDALREFFSHQSIAHDLVKLETASGSGLKSGMNLDDGRSLNEIMELYMGYDR